MEPNKKRPKTEIDFLLGTTEHRTLQVDDKKLILSDGGFVLDEADLLAEKKKDEESKTVFAPPPEVEQGDYPLCEECETRFVSSFLLKNFDCCICDPCKEGEEKFSLMAKSSAREEFLLKDCDFDRREPPLKFITKPNPHNAMGHEMKLYLRLQVEQRSIEVWGSLDELEKEKEKRQEKREKSKVKKFNKEMKQLRMAVRSSEYVKAVKSHEHVFGEETYDDKKDMYSKKCQTCGHVLEYEKM